jgi:hypothetical protein
VVVAAGIPPSVLPDISPSRGEIGMWTGRIFLFVLRLAANAAL